MPPRSPTSSPPVRVEVALAPSLREPPSPRTVAIVVDVIRATTTLSVLFERGCRRVLVAPDIAAARAAHASAADPPPLLAGEVGGLAPPGFDHGNSPAELGALDLREREVIFATTNGTRALLACAGDGAIFAGSFRNARAVCAAALAASARLRAASLTMPSGAGDSGRAAASQADQPSEAAVEDEAPPDIVIVCSGREQRPAYDDTLCAGYLARELMRLALNDRLGFEAENGARIALATIEPLLANWPPLSPVAGAPHGTRSEPEMGERRTPHETLATALANTGAGQAISRVGLAGDLAWCADVDAAQVVPRVTGTAAGLLVVETTGR